MRLNFHTLPPAEALEGMDDLQAVIEEHRATLQEWREGKAKHDQLQQKLVEARRADEAAAVDAYRAGEKDPGGKHEAKVLKELEAHARYMKLRENALPAIEKDLAGVAQKAREKIPALEQKIEEDNQELFSLLEKVRTVQERRAGHKGLIEWLTELPGSYRPIVHTSNGMTEDMALGVLVGSTQPPVENPDEGSVTYLAG